MKYVVCTLNGNAHQVEALYPRVDETGALWFYEGSFNNQPDRIVACVSSQYWSQFRPAEPKESEPHA